MPPRKHREKGSDDETLSSSSRREPFETISSYEFYSTYHGHEPALLGTLTRHLRGRCRRLIFLAGDSTLDNKYWFNDTAAALNGYEAVLRPPIMKQDVAYWLNREAASRGQGTEWACVNTAIEATTLGSRGRGRLLPQDAFIHDNIAPQDVLVVSMGGNDVALSPVLCTVLNMLLLVALTPTWCLETCACACPPPCGTTACCCCCGLPGCLSSCCLGWPLGFGYFVDLFKNQVEGYIRAMLGPRRPALVVACMLYYPDEAGTGSWADAALGGLCYDQAPSRLQTAIRQLFRHATARIRIPGVRVVPFAMHDVLDGKDTGDYVQRVEPSPGGGKKIAAALMDCIVGSLAGDVGDSLDFPTAAPASQQAVRRSAG